MNDEDSSTYMAILEEGAMRGGKKMLLRLGRKRFGPPDEATVAAIEAITELDRLESLVDRLLDVHNWAELFASP